MSNEYYSYHNDDMHRDNIRLMYDNIITDIKIKENIEIARLKKLEEEARKEWEASLFN
jgi:hypothetical protein